MVKSVCLMARSTSFESEANSEASTYDSCLSTKMLKIILKSVEMRNVSTLADELSNRRLGIEERNIKIKKLENAKVYNMDDIYMFPNENRSLLKQRNIHQTLWLIHESDYVTLGGHLYWSDDSCGVTKDRSVGTDSKPILLVIDVYDHWKSRMMHYIIGKDKNEEMRRSINVGPHEWLNFLELMLLQESLEKNN
ncbi:hypothetical protein LXL04_003984 [Taraxacum kok-saghyz]